MVLLVVDTQKLITNEKLYNFKSFVSNVKSLIQTNRQKNTITFFHPKKILIKKNLFIIKKNWRL